MSRTSVDSKEVNSTSGESDSDPGWGITRGMVLAIALIVVATAGAAAAGYALGLFNIGPPISTHFTIIMTPQGFNGSRVHSAPWPIMNVKNGTTVTFHIENHDPVEAHAFSISILFDSGVKVNPNGSDDVTLNINRVGTFTVYCNIICTVHKYMQDGELNVIP